MIAFLKEIVSECPEEILLKYPFVLIMYSYLFRLDGEYEYATKLRRLIDFDLSRNPGHLSKDELRLLQGEYLLLMSLTAYNNIKKVHEGQRAAYELLGGPSRYRLSDIPITMGATSVLSMFWREPGKLNETLADMQKSLPYHIKLTHGQGIEADSVLHAEMMLMRGDDIQAEILCHKALYHARSKQDNCICLCAEQILARVAILRGDADGLLITLDNIKSYAKESSNLYMLRMVDICLSVISIALGTTDMVGKWFFDKESIRKVVYTRAVPYVSISHLYLLVREKRHAESLGLADVAIKMAKEMGYILPQVYGLVFKAEVFYKRGSEREAKESLQEAFELAFPDQIYMPFAQITHMGDMLTNVQMFPELETKPEWKAAVDKIVKLHERYQKSRVKTRNALSQEKSPLTPREREVAILAKARFSHREIAEKLYISQATVRTILYNAYSKLGIHSKSELNNVER